MLGGLWCWIVCVGFGVLCPEMGTVKQIADQRLRSNGLLRICSDGGLGIDYELGRRSAVCVPEGYVGREAQQGRGLQCLEVESCRGLHCRRPSRQRVEVYRV